MKRIHNESKQIERFIRRILHEAQHKALREANEQQAQASAASIASTNAVLATLVHKFSQDFALTLGGALPFTASSLANYQKFWNKHDTDTDFKTLVQQSVVRNKRGTYLCLLNAEALRKFLKPEFAAAYGEHDVLIETYDNHFIWHKIDAQKLAQIVVIAENADELQVLLQRAGTKI